MAETKKTNSTKSTKKTNTTKKATPKNNTKKVAAEKKVASKKSEPVKKDTKKATSKNTAKKVVVEKEVTVNKNEPVKKEGVKTEKVKAKKSSNFLKENSRMIILCLVCVLLIANIVLILVGHKVKLVDGKEMIASVDGKKFTAEDLFTEMKESSGTNTLMLMVDEYIISKELKNEEEAKKEAQTQVDSIKSQYESAGYDWNEVLTGYGYENEDALYEEFLLAVKQEMVAKKYIKKDITEEEIKKHYDENVYGTYTVKHILIQPDTTDEMSEDEITAAEEQALATANEVIESLNNGSDWATLVSEYSEDEGSKENEGLVENFTKGDVVDEFFNASIALENGKYSTEPVKSEYGYHVILKVSSTDKKSLKDSKEDIINTLVENKLSEDSNLYNNTWREIRKKYKLTIKDTTIKNAYEKTNE